ncbi:MAG TPA: hypothetical protein VIG36_09365 [Methylocystis sp.]
MTGDNEQVSAAVVANWTQCDERTVREYAERGVITRVARGKYALKTCVQAISRHLREVAAGRGGEAAGLELSAERARLAKEQADGQAIKNATLRGELIEADIVERRWADILSSVKAQMLGIPSELAQALPHLTRHDLDEIDRVIRDALTRAAE